MKEYQVTLFDKSGKYKPVACIIKSAEVIDLSSKDARKNLIKRGTEKICIKRGWTKNDILRYNYLVAKVRENINE